MSSGMEIAVFQRNSGYVLRIPLDWLPMPPPARIKLICFGKDGERDVIETHLVNFAKRYSYYRVYSRHELKLLQHMDAGSQCTIAFDDGQKV